MKLEFELWHLITLVITLIAAYAGLVKLLLWQFAREMRERIQASSDASSACLQAIQRDSQKWHDLELKFYQLLADMPVTYVRREDWARGQGVLESKLDAIAVEVKNIQIQGGRK
ncbi:hypothetical protein [Pseudomonas sp. UBA6323]|uniref:hypothetical protein n=1 Tax=Pseudomonas sp. UBA6323 TaxID=1947329 RepID=UPI0025CC0166|nr:hypothetical protein [Pseudomonas sp. UBA6323]